MYVRIVLLKPEVLCLFVMVWRVSSSALPAFFYVIFSSPVVEHGRVET